MQENDPPSSFHHRRVARRAPKGAERGAEGRYSPLVSARSKQANGRVLLPDTLKTIAWPGKRSAAQVAVRDLSIGPGKRSRTQGVPKPVRRASPKPRS